MLEGVAETYVCPVCDYPGLLEPAWVDDVGSQEICPRCGTQFGYDDAAGGDSERRALRHQELRAQWESRRNA